MNAPDLPPNTVITTGDGVPLELETATVFSRMLSGLIDYSLLTIIILLTLGSLDYTTVVDFNDPQTKAISTLTIAIGLVFLPALVTAASGGRTIGKLITRTQVVRADGGSISVRDALSWSLVGIGEVWMTLGALATIVAAFSKTGSRMGDLFAGTLVIRRIPARPRQRNTPLSPEVEHWASNATFQGAPASLVNAAATHLAVMEKMAPATREERSRTLAAQLREYATPHPPAETAAEMFIAAALAAIARNGAQAAQASLKKNRTTSSRATALPYGLE